MYRLYLFFYSIKYKIFNFIKFLFFKIKIGKNTEINGSLFLKGRGSITIGKNVIINSGYIFNPIGGATFTSLVVEKNANLTIKDNVGMSNTAIYCSKSIIVEEFVLIGGGCKIYDTDFHSVNLNDRKNTPETGIKFADVLICSGVFIGAGSIILKGVIIGENAIIGAGSVVSKNVPSNQIWAGNPAKFIKNI